MGDSMSKLEQYLKNSLLFSIVFISFAASSQEIEEVVVTATKKAESAQDLALSIQAFTADQLSVEQIYDMTDLAEVVPGLGVSKGVGSGSAWSMRGIGSYGVGAAVVSSMVTSVNGHSTNVSYMNDLGFMDLERIEVLKGPQGTLFGRNSVAGVINLVTARPSNELGGSFDIEIGNYNKRTTNAVINLPLSDVVRTRLAVMTNTRDGMVMNLNTDTPYDDRNDIGLRLSLDWDVSDRTQLKLTYSAQESDDSRPQEEATYCRKDSYFGCSPYVAGDFNQSADSRGHFGGLAGFIAMFDASTSTVDRGIGPRSDSFNSQYLNRSPVHQQTVQVANLELVHEINDNLQMLVKYSYDDRLFNQMNDNDGGVSTVPLNGLAAGLGFPPLAFNTCFGGDMYSFCEDITTDRIYDFSEVSTWSDQAEINLISDYDGPVNFTVGYYNFDQRNDNLYMVQTAGTQVMGSFGFHPYSPALNAVFGVDLSGKGGVPAYQAIAGWLAAVATGDPTAMAKLGAALALPDVVVPVNQRGTHNDQHIRIKSKALYGEVYIDLSENTELTIGARYNDDIVKATTYNDTLGLGWIARQCAARGFVNKMDCPGMLDQQVVADDAFAYKIALKHNISDDVMVYGSYSTATKAGGVNAGDNPGTYDKEETAVLDFGIKSILLDGAMLLNMNIFFNDNQGMLLATIENAGSHNYNADAEINGFEGQMSLFLSETSQLELTWLAIDNEITNDVLAVNYLDPAGAPYRRTSLSGPIQAGLHYAVFSDGAGNTQTWYKSAGYNCNVPFNGLSPVGCPTGNVGNEQNLRGLKLPGTTDLEYSLAYTQLFPTVNGMTSARLAYRVRGETNGDPFGYSRFDIPEQKVWDLIVRHEPGDGDWYVGLYAKNLADDRQMNAIRAASNLQGGQMYASYTDPRTFGINFGTSF
jgi:outer membrane receptor protein involved in Fe transport